jgi:hypothetical protein
MRYVKKTALEKKMKKNKLLVPPIVIKKPVLSPKSEDELQFFRRKKDARDKAKSQRQLVLEKHLPENKKSLWRCIHCNEHTAFLIKAVQSRSIDEGQVYDFMCKQKTCLKTFRVS